MALHISLHSGLCQGHSSALAKASPIVKTAISGGRGVHVLPPVGGNASHGAWVEIYDSLLGKES